MTVDGKKTQGISVVTTTWNERENIAELIRRVRQTLADKEHEVIVVDDSSSDGTYEVAKKLADVAVSKAREGQSKGLLDGMKLAKFPIVVTIDSDLENSPELIPVLVDKLAGCDIVVAGRTLVPRWSERFAAKTLGKWVGVSDFYSNFRACSREVIANLRLVGDETFGGEMLVAAKKKGYRINEVLYEAPPRRSRPRIGGSLKANLRISWATVKCFMRYAF